MLNKFGILLTHSGKASLFKNFTKIHSACLIQSCGFSKFESFFDKPLPFLLTNVCNQKKTNTLMYFERKFNSSKNVAVIESDVTVVHFGQPESTSEFQSEYNSDLIQLWNLRNHYKEGDVKILLLNDSKFREICTQLMKKLRYLTPREVHSLVHLIVVVNFPTNIGITKGVLQMLRIHLNEYDAYELSDIYQLLDRYQKFERDPQEAEPSNPVLEALLIAIPKAIEIKIIGKQFNAKRADILLTILTSTTMANASTDSIRFLLQVISIKLKFMNVPELNTLYDLLNHQHIQSNIDVIGRPLVQQILDSYWRKKREAFRDEKPQLIHNQ